MKYNQNYGKDVKILSTFINKIVSYKTQHDRKGLEDWKQLIDVIALLMDNDVDKRDWYNLCNSIPPEVYETPEWFEELSECEKWILDKEGEEALARYQGRI